MIPANLSIEELVTMHDATNAHDLRCVDNRYHSGMVQARTRMESLELKYARYVRT